MTKHLLCATMSLIVRIVLPLKIVIGGKINPTAATVRMTVKCLFSESEINLSALMISRVPCQEILEFYPCYQLREINTFES